MVATQCADPELDDSSESAAQVSLVPREGAQLAAAWAELGLFTGVLECICTIRMSWLLRFAVGGVSEPPEAVERPRLRAARYWFRKSRGFLFRNPQQSF